MSFGNGIYTSGNGKHVSYLTDQIVSHIQPLLEKRLKRDIKPSVIKQHLCVFCNCLIENPTFDSQTKECLVTTSRVCEMNCIKKYRILVLLLSYQVLFLVN